MLIRVIGKPLMSADHLSTSRTCDPSPLTPSVSFDGAGTQPAQRPRRLGTVWRRVLAGALTLFLLVLVPGVSYAQALTYPGSATWQMRSVEWLRDNGGSPLVDRIENWYYTANRPTGPAPDAAGLPVITAGRSLLAPPPPARARRGPPTAPGRPRAPRPPHRPLRVGRARAPGSSRLFLPLSFFL